MKTVITRLEVQVEHLAKEVAGLRGLMIDQKSPIDVRVDRHEQQTKEQFSEIKESLKGLHTKLETGSKPNYAPIIAGIALAWSISSAIGGFFINSQNATISRIERDIANLQQSDVPRTELNDKFREVHRRLEAVENKRPASSR